MFTQKKKEDEYEYVHTQTHADRDDSKLFFLSQILDSYLMNENIIIRRVLPDLPSSILN